MELIALYIEDFNGVHDSFIKTSSKFTIKYEHKTLIVRQDVNRDKYYDGIPSTLLIGQNGTGKTTILTFIEDFHYDNENTGFMVWFCDDTIYITSKGSQPSVINSPYNSKIIHSNVDFFAENRIFTIKSNNTVDFNSYLFGSRKKTAKNFIDISLSNTGKGKSNKKQEIAKIFKFINTGKSLPDTINNDKISILANLTLTASERTRKILRDRDFRLKHEKDLIDFFNYYYNKYNSSLAHPNKEFHFIKNDNFESYINSKKGNWRLSFFSFFFSKLSNGRHTDHSTQDAIFLTLTSILYPFSKKITPDFDYLYLKLVIVAFFSNPFNVTTEIEYVIKDYYPTINEDKVINELIILKNNFKLITAIIYKLYNHQNKITIKESEFNFLIKKPELVADLIGMSNALPKEFDAIFSIEWNGLSSGEVSLLHLFSSIYNSVNQINKSHDRNTVLLLLDEIDLYLHPEWQRKMFSDILDMLNEFNHDIKFQVLMSSHSPIIASDFLPIDIITLTRGAKNNIITGTLENIGFGESIENTMSQGFFLKATVGERVLKKVEELIKRKDDKIFLANNEYITSLIKNKFLTYILGIKND
ncbi:AAA family ATPase [Citrobacter freundii]|uniref:AAA family ATPase n=1 Tax=Citrobacter freundii TaxID=546 RepID=A0A9P3Z5W6_CITFR|nr:AAA family ATPase [Citrobacter freundii]HED3688539.1 AAA family ATPase [Citrobacter freundii]